MSDQLAKADGLWTTVTPSVLSALDISDISAADFRPQNWWTRPEDIQMQAIENDTAFLAFLESGMVGQEFDMSQPIVKWRVGRPADLWTTNNKAIAAADTYLDLVDSLIVRTGQTLHFTDYDVMYRVIDVDDDGATWQNNNSDYCNVRVERLTGPAVVIAAGTICQGGIHVMSEIGVPTRGTTTTPGDPIYNLMTMVGIYGSMSNLQKESDMVGGWGTHPKIRDEIFFQHRLQKQWSMLFQHRYTGTDSQVSNSQLYMSAGVIPQIKSHVMEAGSLGVSLVGPKLNDFWELLFDNENSGSSKDHFCGSAQFRDVRKAAVEYGLDVEMLGIQSGVQNANALGTNSFVVTLNSGRKVTVHELRKAFGAANMVDWGVTLDSTNLGLGAYRNIREVWVDDIEDPAQKITLRSDALIDTWSVCVKDETTCGVIRGGTRALVER